MVRVRVGSVGLGFAGLILGLELVLGSRFVLGENVREGKCPGVNVRHSLSASCFVIERQPS